LKKKILIIGFPNSVHTLNWINSVDLTKFKVFFFPSTSSNLSCINDKRVTYYEDHYEISKLKIFLYRFLSLLSLDKFFFTPKIYIKQIIHNKYLLKDYIFFLQPDIIHSLEIQHSGYLTYDAINKSNFLDKRLILSNYGSDIYYFQNLNSHKKKIIKVLNFFSEIVCESKRDINLCKKYNKKIKTNLILNSTGIKFDNSNKPNLNLRKNIILKGYQGKFGRVLLIISYLYKIIDEINYENLFIFSSDLKTRLIIKLFYPRLKIIFLKTMSKDNLLKYFKKSIIYIGASISDGVSTSALDSISTKTFPLQSNTSTLRELFDEKSISYSLYNYNDFKKKFLFVFNKVDKAQKIIDNLYVSSKKYDDKIEKLKISKLYST